MKKDIHPKYNKNVTVTCACGNKFVTGSTVEVIHVEICHKCHPFWTGAQKFVDTEGRVDKFKKKQQIAKKAKKERIKKLKEKLAKEKQKKEAPKSLKEILKQMQ